MENTQQKSIENQQITVNNLPQQPKKTKQLITGIPQHYSQNVNLKHAISILPPHYNFEIYKTLYRIQQAAEELQRKNLTISLQFPQGLMLYACIISDILKAFSLQINKIEINTVIMGDVTYGACCVDDIASDLMECDLLVHYGHSCLVPITQTRRKVLYVFVEIQIDIEHFIETCIFNFSDLKKETLYLMSTIQFNNSLFITKQRLVQNGFQNIVIPQEKPRSAGQVLGCTSPALPVKQEGRNIVIFLCDGRFHMEATMIANPKFQFYQYDPYTRNITQEKYATDLMIQRRSEQIQKAAAGQTKTICFILGTLGRQGNPQILNRLIKKIEGLFEYMILLASQINTELLNILPVDFYVQIACPRLSIDWAYGTPKPLLTPYELYVLIDKINIKQHYSMDFYSMNGGPWSNFYGRMAPKGVKKPTKTKAKVQLKMEDSQKLEEPKIQNS